ncbi:unnamed protein product [Brachionus calyciflorus]|uniref:RING-type domain-containing protein n=1 Tax=Brachionus calyciflorus TaxID=104777 RepID=A0A813ZXY4_9BILA|nr:unnamed protein product [Brachionus calyciflorus]
MSSNEHHHKNINIKSSILNEHFQCGICQGYIIDATTITDCLHSFCKSCIIHFIINIDHMCPTCNSRLKDVKNCIKSDAALQRLIYRMVPSLLDNEIERREKFYQTDSKNEDLLLSKKTYLNLKLVYKNRKKIKIEDKENLKNENSNKNDLIQEKYIQCIAQTPIHIITKLLRNKFNLPFNYKVKLTHSGYKLNEDETLLQVFTCFLMNKNDYFEIEYEFNKIKLKSNENTTTSTSKASPNKKIKLIKKNDHYLKLKEKRANKPNKQVNFSIKKTDDKKSEITNEKNSVNVTNNTNNVVNEQLIDSDQPLDLTINK